MELPETGDVSARLLAGILSAINEQDGVPPSSVQPLEYANNYTSKLLHIENDELKARICALEAHVMELEAQVGDKSTKISEVEALYALEKTQFQVIVKGHISETKELQDTVVRLQSALDKADKTLPAASVKGGDANAAAGLHMSAMITDKMSRILSMQSSMETSLSTITAQQEKLRTELENARNDAIQAVAHKKEVELHVGKLRDTIGGLRTTLMRKEVHIGDLTKTATLGELHLSISRKENAEMGRRLSELSKQISAQDRLLMDATATIERQKAALQQWHSKLLSS